MAVETHIYDNRFFRNTVKLETESAAAFVDIVLEHYSPKSVVDIGCGAGIYLKELERRGINDLLGLDGSPSAAEEFVSNKEQLVIFDLSKPYKFSKKYDLCFCLEVAEHLPKEDADILVETIVNSSDNIIFTAAVPGQGPRSIGHINEQPHEYWIEKFKTRGFVYLEELSLKMRQEMEEKKVVWWIVNNLMVFKNIQIL